MCKFSFFCETEQCQEKIFTVILLKCVVFSDFRRMYKGKLSSTVREDVDVATERKRVLKGSGKRDLLRLENLTKVGHSTEYSELFRLGEGHIYIWKFPFNL